VSRTLSLLHLLSSFDVDAVDLTGPAALFAARVGTLRRFVRQYYQHWIRFGTHLLPGVTPPDVELVAVVRGAHGRLRRLLVEVAVVVRPRLVEVQRVRVHRPPLVDLVTGDVPVLHPLAANRRTLRPRRRDPGVIARVLLAPGGRLRLGQVVAELVDQHPLEFDVFADDLPVLLAFAARRRAALPLAHRPLVAPGVEVVAGEARTFGELALGYDRRLGLFGALGVADEVTRGVAAGHLAAALAVAVAVAPAAVLPLGTRVRVALDRHHRHHDLGAVPVALLAQVVPAGHPPGGHARPARLRAPAPRARHPPEPALVADDRVGHDVVAVVEAPLVGQRLGAVAHLAQLRLVGFEDAGAEGVRNRLLVVEVVAHHLPGGQAVAAARRALAPAADGPAGARPREALLLLDAPLPGVARRRVEDLAVDVAEVGLGAEAATARHRARGPLAGLPHGALLDVAPLLGELLAAAEGVVDDAAIVVDAVGRAPLVAAPAARRALDKTPQSSTQRQHSGTAVVPRTSSCTPTWWTRTARDTSPPWPAWEGCCSACGRRLRGSARSSLWWCRS
jgi:hypothetical protein